MKKLFTVLATVIALSMSTTVYAAGALQGSWVNASGSVLYVFDGNGGGYMEHATHRHKITYTIDGNNLKIAFPDNDGHGLSDSFTFEVEGDLLKLTVEGKTGAQRYEKRPDGWTRPEQTGTNQSGDNDPHDHDHDESGNMTLWLLVGGAGGALLTTIVCIIIVKNKAQKERKMRRAAAARRPGDTDGE